MKAYVGVTDVDWYRQLSANCGERQQVNFWSPGGNRAFAALSPGELFLFKTRARDGNQIVGGGIYDAFVFMRIVDAWELLAAENGVQSLDQFRERVRMYRRTIEPLAFDACQWPIVSAQRRPTKVPTGGHENCPGMANRSAHQDLGGVGHEQLLV